VLAVPLFFPKGAHKLTVLPGLSLLNFKKDFSEVRFIPGFTPGLHRPWLASRSTSELLSSSLNILYMIRYYFTHIGDKYNSEFKNLLKRTYTFYDETSY
jgi:hypothetical protein